MLITILLYIVGYILQLIALILPKWVVWPDSVLNGIDYIVQTLSGLNFILPIDTFFEAFVFLLHFEFYFWTAIIIAMVFNFFRGSGKGIEI